MQPKRLLLLHSPTTHCWEFKAPSSMGSICTVQFSMWWITPSTLHNIKFLFIFKKESCLQEESHFDQLGKRVSIAITTFFSFAMTWNTCSTGWVRTLIICCKLCHIVHFLRASMERFGLKPNNYTNPPPPTNPLV